MIGVVEVVKAGREVQAETFNSSALTLAAILFVLVTIPLALHVLRGIDLVVAPSSVVCVIGPSGGGKSTLLRCVNLLEPPTRGASSSKAGRSRAPASRTSTWCGAGSAWCSSSSTCSLTRA